MGELVGYRCGKVSNYLIITDQARAAFALKAHEEIFSEAPTSLDPSVLEMALASVDDLSVVQDAIETSGFFAYIFNGLPVDTAAALPRRRAAVL